MSTSFKPTESPNGMQWRDDNGKEIAAVGRGTTDTDITFLKLYDSNGLATYIYPTTGGTSVTVTTTIP